MKVAYISTFDSFVRANHVLAEALGKFDIQGDHFLMLVRGNQITLDQVVGILGTTPQSVQSVEDTVTEVLNRKYDWIVLSAENTSCRRFFHAFAKAAGDARPLVATIYPGIIFRHHIDGFSARMPADLVILNSRKDQRLYRDLANTLGRPDNSFDLGPVTAIGKRGNEPLALRNQVVFFDQPSVPRTPDEKAYLFGELLKLADRFPDHEFCVKLRINPKEQTLHKGGQGALRIFEECNRRANGMRLKLVEGPPREVIGRAKLCLSVSSTALVEALACGCPAVAITDFGIDDEYGGSYFIGSGIASPLAGLNPDYPPSVSSDWVLENLGNPDGRIPVLAEEMHLMLTRRGAGERHHVSVFPAYGSPDFFAFGKTRFGERRTIERHYRKPEATTIRRILSFIARWGQRRRNVWSGGLPRP